MARSEPRRALGSPAEHGSPAFRARARSISVAAAASSRVEVGKRWPSRRTSTRQPRPAEAPRSGTRLRVGAHAPTTPASRSGLAPTLSGVLRAKAKRAVTSAPAIGTPSTSCTLPDGSRHIGRTRCAVGFAHQQRSRPACRSRRARPARSATRPRRAERARNGHARPSWRSVARSSRRAWSRARPRSALRLRC